MRTNHVAPLTGRAATDAGDGARRRPAAAPRAMRSRGGTRVALALLAGATSMAALGAGSAGATIPTRAVTSAASGCTLRGLAQDEPSHRLPTRAVGGYRRIYCDDFRGLTLGQGWFRFEGQPGGDPGAMFLPSHVRVVNGMLTINTYRDRSISGHWASGGVCHCGLARTYGAFYVRSRVTGPGDDNDELLWPAQHIWPPEIDFNETSPHVTRTGSYVHYDADNQQIRHELSINLTRWHTWGVIWTPNSVTFTVDGRVWGRVTARAAIPHVPMTLDIQEQTFCFNGTACPTHPVSLQVDWVAEFARA